MYGENQNIICDTSNKKKQRGFKAMVTSTLSLWLIYMQNIETTF